MMKENEMTMGFCLYCDGTGKVDGKPCKKCEGKGSLPVDRVRDTTLKDAVIDDDDGYQD